MSNLFQRAFKDERRTKALIGLSSKEFYDLAKPFEENLEKSRNSPKNTRKRAPGGGKKHTLSLLEEKLFFILYYFKTYPTFDVLAADFNVDRGTACRWVQAFLPVLEQTLEQEGVLPKRETGTVEEFIENFPEVDELYIDGTERPTQRPSDYALQKEFFSGKKKDHTNKNLVLSNACREILVLSKTKPGRNHDYALFKELNPQIPSYVVNWVDLGFQGIEKDFPSLEVIIPNKKPRGGELTADQKADNTMVARMRIVSEHAIGGIKRLKVVTDVFRNRKKNFADLFMLLACGLWNFHLTNSFW
jgi:hypothetical protein